MVRRISFTGLVLLFGCRSPEAADEGGSSSDEPTGDPSVTSGVDTSAPSDADSSGIDADASTSSTGGDLSTTSSDETTGGENVEDCSDILDDDPAPETVLWTYQHHLQMAFAPALDDAGNVYLQGKSWLQTPENAPTVVALSCKGTFLWGAVTSPATVPPPPVSVAGDVVVAPASAHIGGQLLGRLFRFDRDGQPLQHVDLDGPVGDGAAWDGSRWFVPSTSVFAIEGEQPAWTFPLVGDGKTGTNVAIGPEGNVYVGARGQDTSLYAISPTGQKLWSIDVGRAFIDPIAVDHAGRVHAITAGGLLLVHEANGQEAWRHQNPWQTAGGGLTIDAAGTVYYGVTTAQSFFEDMLFAVREASDGEGEVVWSVSAGHNVSVTPALSGHGTLYVGSSCGRFGAYRMSDGESLWSFQPFDTAGGNCGGRWSAATIGPDGIVYASVSGADEPGRIYAFAGDGSGLAEDAPWPGEQRDVYNQSSLYAPPPRQ